MPILRPRSAVLAAAVASAALAAPGAARAQAPADPSSFALAPQVTWYPGRDRDPRMALGANAEFGDDRIALTLGVAAWEEDGGCADAVCSEWTPSAEVGFLASVFRAPWGRVYGGAATGLAVLPGDGASPTALARAGVEIGLQSGAAVRLEGNARLGTGNSDPRFGLAAGLRLALW